jgi:hypothetical protein
MLYLLIAIIVLVTALLLTRLRLRLEVSDDRRLLFVGLGRTGPELDFRTKRGVLRLFGFRIGEFAIRRGEKKVADEIKKAIEEAAGDRAAPTKEKAKKAKRKRKRSIRDIVAVVPQSLRAVGKYFLGLVKAAVVEQAEGEIEAGFASPDLTGQVYGYYQAALGVAPALVGRVAYTPIWTGPSFSGVVRCAVAWPVYRIVWQTTLLVFRLPVTKIIKLAIGTKEGVQDGK